MPHTHTVRGPGESRPFHLVSAWAIPTTAERAWHVLADVAQWPAWWPGMVAADVARPEAAGGTGEQARLRVRSPLGYRLDLELELTGADAPHLATLAVAGDLRGTGTWTAEEAADGTRMTITWCVVSTHPLLRVLRPVAARAHARVMASGQAGLRRRLAEQN